MAAGQTGSRAIVEPNETGRLGLAIEPFQTILKETDFQGHYSPRIRALQSRLLAIGLKRRLSDNETWGSIRLAPGLATKDELILRAALTFAADLPVKLSIDLQDQRANTLFRHHYELAKLVPAYSEAVPQPGKTDPYQALFTTIASDLQVVLERISDEDKKELQRAARENYFNSNHAAVLPSSIAIATKEAEGLSQRVDRALVYDELILQTINSYFSIYYDDLLAPYATWLAAGGSNEMGVSALLETESVILARQLTGIGSIVEAVALQFSDQTPKDALPLSLLLKNQLLARYSHFQTLEERRRAQASFDGLGLINDKPEPPPMVVALGADQMALNVSVEEQYAWWRRMIVDLVAAPEETTQDTMVPGQ
ncbi:MAG: hypothetical protein WBW79_03210 [Desulfocapsaceae bacterium]